MRGSARRRTAAAEGRQLEGVKLSLSLEDLDALTEHRALCDAAGDLGPREFEEAMRRQAHID